MASTKPKSAVNLPEFPGWLAFRARETQAVASPGSDAEGRHQPRDTAIPPWRTAGKRYFDLNFALRRRFGERVQKVSLDAGFTCPNVDGTVATGGCTFCDNRSFSPSRRVPRMDVLEQLDDGIRRLKTRYDVDRFIAYFQPATNTYAPVERLRSLYERALSHPQVVGLAIGTRPDCVPDEVLDLLQNLAEQTYLSVEYGLQTMHDRSLDWMNRGHHHNASIDALERSRGRGFEICAHIMLGLPGESHADMLATAREVARLPIDAVKIHNLYAVKRTALAEQVERGEVRLLGRDEYISVLVDFLEIIPPEMVVERISGDAPDDYFIGPAWCLDKPGVLRALAAEFERRNTWQGKKYEEHAGCEE
ncbi:MAG: TIGR01212 family radical SAM protein [Pirellulaceae bacterium]|nr:TIGR01212 family radical SAM protein [Pirellulaceae bacterium]